MRQLNYNHLYYFYITAREGSIAKAAEVLHVTPQTVSGQITTFEQYLGFALFDRRGKRLHLNTHGKVAYQSAEEIFSKGQALVETLQAREHGHLHQFTIGITDVIPKVLAFDFVKSAMKSAETTRFIFKEGDFETLVGELAINKLDLILSDRPISPGTPVKALSHFLGETGISFFAQCDKQALSNNFPRSLHHAPMLLPGDKSRMKTVLEAWFNEQQLRPDIVAEFDDSALLKRFGEEGFGAFCAPSIIEQDVVKQYNVACIGRIADIKERYYAITGHDNQKRPIVKTLMEETKAIFAEKSKD